MHINRQFRLPRFRARGRWTANRIVLLLTLGLVLCGPAVNAQDRLLISVQRPVADLVYTLGGKLNHNPPNVNNAQLISQALKDRSKSVITLPAGIIEITEPIVWPDRTGITLLGAGEGGDYGDSHYSSSTGAGGTATRLVANFDTADKSMIEYHGVHGRISGISFEGYTRPGAFWNFIVSATDAIVPNPIVCTTDYAFSHGLSDGDQVSIYGVPVGNNEAANGTFYIKKTGYNSNQFALYSDPGLTTAVSGSGNGDYSGSSTVIWRPVNRAQIGIHVYTQTGTTPTGKLDVRNCEFLDIPVGILFGYSMDEAYKMEDVYEGSEPQDPLSNHADESVVDHCTFDYPFNLSYPDTEHRTCIYVRAIQALGFDFRFLALAGTADEFLYFERGGDVQARCQVNGNCQNGILRLGRPSFNTKFVLWAGVDGGSGPGSIGRFTTILGMDSLVSSNGSHIEISGNYKPAYGFSTYPLTQPLFVIRGPTKVVLQDFNGLMPNAIQLVGSIASSNPEWQYLAHAVLRNCVLYFTSNVSNIVTPISGGSLPNSQIPYYWRYEDCQRGNKVDVNNHRMFNQPLIDGDDQTHLGNSEFGP